MLTTTFASRRAKKRAFGSNTASTVVVPAKTSVSQTVGDLFEIDKHDDDQKSTTSLDHEDANNQAEEEKSQSTNRLINVYTDTKSQDQVEPKSDFDNDNDNISDHGTDKHDWKVRGSQESTDSSIADEAQGEIQIDLSNALVQSKCRGGDSESISSKSTLGIASSISCDSDLSEPQTDKAEKRVHETKSAGSDSYEKDIDDNASNATTSIDNNVEEMNENLSNCEVDDQSENSAPSLDDILASTERLFEEVDDKATVTVNDILQLLQIEYNVSKFDKTTKTAVRKVLTELVTQDHQAYSSAEESDKEPYSSADESENKPRLRKPRTNKKIAKAAAQARKHAETLRKRRLAELKVRQEELVVNEQDEERAEQIAAKFDTNTDEQRLQRLQQRIGLLQKLDTKRMAVLENRNIAESITGKEVKKVPHASNTLTVDNAYVELDGDDDDDELEIVGEQKLIWPKLQPITQPDPIALLKMPRKLLAQRKTAKPLTQTGNTRTALRKQLLLKQRKTGNRWLARELGYDDEAAHVKDCLAVERKKYELTLQRDALRREANEKRALRDLQLAEVGDLDDASDEELAEANSMDNNNPTIDAVEGISKDADSTGESEDDEEQAWARKVSAETNASAGKVKEVGTDDDASTLSVLQDATESFKESKLSTTSNDIPTSNDDAQIETEIHIDAEDKAVKDIDDDEKSVTSNFGDKENECRSSADTSVTETGTSTIKRTDNDKIADEKPAVEPKKNRNSAWKAMLAREAEIAKKDKKRGHNGLLDIEAEEEEEEDVAGLEDFGFVVNKKKKKSDDDEEDDTNEFDEEELKHVVDDLSDDEGDEDEGERARKLQEAREEKERHKEVIRRMREGYDGRRGGITGGIGARGLHRFDQLVAADNREEARQLGLLNEDELDSDNEGDNNDDGKNKDNAGDDEDDEVALLDKILKDRFLHRSNVELEEKFSEDEDDAGNEDDQAEDGIESGIAEDAEELEQAKLARQFTKRARMQRLIEEFGQDEEFTQSKLIDEDESIRAELEKMRSGLSRKRNFTALSQSSSVSSSQRQQSSGPSLLSSIPGFQSSQSILFSSQNSNRTSFVRNASDSVQHRKCSAPVVVFGNSSSGSKMFGKKLKTSDTSSISRPTQQKVKSASASLWTRAGMNKLTKK